MSKKRDLMGFGTRRHMKKNVLRERSKQHKLIGEKNLGKEEEKRLIEKEEETCFPFHKRELSEREKRRQIRNGTDCEEHGTGG